MDTLAVRLTIPPVGLVRDFYLEVNPPCRAHLHEAPEASLGALALKAKPCAPWEHPPILSASKGSTCLLLPDKNGSLYRCASRAKECINKGVNEKCY
jgi:hypothetical protein